MNGTCLAFLVLLTVNQEKILPELPINEEVIKRLDKLKPNECAVVGKAKVLGEFNETAKRFELDRTGPRGRDFTIKMVWAPERKRVLFCGANHGVPHRLNDFWEFDLASLSWVMLYAPDNARDYLGLGKDFSDVEFKSGTFITKRGGPAVIAHTWWGFTYDPETRKALFMNTWVTDQKKAATQLGASPADLYAGAPLWAFSPQEKKWQFLPTPTPYPKAIFGGWLEYIPSLRGSLWHVNNWQERATWVYDFKSNTWRNLLEKKDVARFEKNAAEPEQVGYYDPDRKILIAHRHKATSHFDPVKNEWKKVIDGAKDDPDLPHGHDAYAPMYHDSSKGKGILVEFKTNTLWRYHPDETRWEKLNPEGDKMPEGNKRLAYFDHAHGVFVVIHDTTVWAYRPK